MKGKLLACLVLLVSFSVGVGNVSAQEKETEKGSTFGLFISPSAYAILGSENWVRGFAGAVDVRISLVGIFIGLQALVEYDAYFQTGNFPIFLTLGGENFWIGAGQTIGLATPTYGTEVYRYGTFPNTYCLGFGIPIVPLSEKSKIKIGGQLTYTRTEFASSGNGSVDQLLGIVAVLAGLKFYAGVTFQLGL